MMKRVIDILLAATGLLVLLPVFLSICVAIKLDGPGPLLFRQTRVGRGGALFRIAKFRTMKVGADKAGPAITTRGDQRITKVGSWLRRYKLDELPQLFNVLGGSMSLVGPRPEVPEYMSLYTPQQRDIILSVRPGMTDFAAIELRDEEAILAGYTDSRKAYVEVLMPRKAALYERYVSEQSVGLDLLLILRTLMVIAGKRIT